MALTRARKTFFLVVLSLLIAPWFHSLIKPYRLRVDVQYFHDTPTPIYVYFSNNARAPTAFDDERVEPLYIETTQEAPAPMALTRANLRSTRPITGLRIDPSAMPNALQMGSVTLHTYTGNHVLSAAELEPHVRAGNQIANVRLQDGVLHFDATGNDPNFLVPVPADILNVPRSLIYFNYLLSWAVAAAVLLFLVALVGKHGLTYTGQWRRPIAVTPAGSPARQRWLGLALDLGAGALMLQMVLAFIHLTSRFDISQLVHALDHDGVGNTVPIEVRQMKALVARHGNHSYVLPGDMGKGDDESEIFQRATEYLYPSRIVHQSKWVFARKEWNSAGVPGRCTPVDQEISIVLYACDPEH